MATYFSSGHFQGRNASCPASFRHCLRRAAGLVAAIEVGAPTLYLLAAQLAASRALGGGKGVWRRLPDFFCPESEVLTTGFEETGFLVAALTSSALLASVATIDGWLESIAAEPGRLTARMGVPPTTRGRPRTVIACPTCSGPSLFTNRIRGRTVKRAAGAPCTVPVLICRFARSFRQDWEFREGTGFNACLGRALTSVRSVQLHQGKRAARDGRTQRVQFQHPVSRSSDGPESGGCDRSSPCLSDQMHAARRSSLSTLAS